MSTLFYHKCDDCLTPFSSTERHIDFCDCNGSVTFMGVVQGDKYVKTENKPACDGRCTHACGPVCDCQCGGVNHGTGRMVQTVVAEGKVKAVGLTEEDIERAHKFRQFRDYAEKQYALKHGDVLDKVKNRIYVDRPAYMAMLNGRRMLDKILSLRVYERRHNELAKFIIANDK